MAFGKAETSHVEDAISLPAPPTKRQKFARHCKRWWWVHLAIFICSSILQITLIIFVAVPKIAQSKLNGVKLTVDGMEISDPKADSYHLRVNSTIQTDGKVKATVSPFEGVMYLEDFKPHTPFTAVSFPKTNANKHQVVNISQRVQISDMEAFTRFNIWFQANETTRLTMYGKTKVQPKGLNRKYSVTFKKTIELKGLNGLKGVKLVESHLVLDGDSKGPNLKGMTEIPNPSSFTMEIGNVTFANFIGQDNVGTLQLQDLVLAPGRNLINFTAKMDSAAILDAVNKKPYCETGVIPLKLQAKSVKSHGQELEYFSTAMGLTNQTVEADVGSMVSDAAGIKIKCSS